MVGIALVLSAAATEGQSISGGDIDVVDTAVVGIVDTQTSGTCTGSLLAPNLVLTAQHCVAEVLGVDCETGSFGEPFDAGRLYVTTRHELSSSPGDYHRAATVVVPPEQGFCGWDIALIVLADNVEAGEATPLDPRLDAAAELDEPYSAVGFGATGSETYDAGVRHRRDGLVAACVEGCGSWISDQEWVGEAGVCQGDSGGPALDASGAVLGVASRGAYDCSAPVYADLTAHRGWIVEAAADAAAAGDYDTPAWAGGGGGDTGDTAEDGGEGDTAEGADDSGGDPAGDDGAEEPGGCGCSAGGAEMALGAWVLAATAIRRRRRG